MPAGAPRKYDAKKHCKQIYQFALLGATDQQMADFLEVHLSTFYQWKIDFPEFSEAIKEGKDLADAQVTKALFKRATGYSHKEDKIFQYEGSPIVVPTIKHYPPDTLACIYWLNNRQPAKWRNNKDDEAKPPIEVPNITIKYESK